MLWTTRRRITNVAALSGAGSAGPVTIDVNPGTSQRSGASVSTFPYTGLTTTGAANAIVCLINIETQNPGITSVTWDAAGANQAFTDLGVGQNGAVAAGANVSIWALLAPASSGAKTITVNWTTATQCMMAAVSLIGVNASLATAFPVGSRTNGTLTSTTSPSFNVTSAAGHISFGIISNRGTTLSLPTGGTAIFTDNAGAASDAAAQFSNSGSTATFGWTNAPADVYGFAGVDASP